MITKSVISANRHVQGPVGERGGSAWLCLVVEEVAWELGWAGSVPGSAVSWKAFQAEGSKAFISVVKNFMKTGPVIEMAGVQPVPCRCSVE